MSLNRTVSVILSGLVIMMLSGLGGYYWASTSSGNINLRSTPTDKKTSQTPDPSPEPASTSSGDSQNLSPSSWESFLDYEGKRIKMLGVNKKYTTINFRKGPGTEYPILSTPKGGTLLEILDKFGEWYRSRLREGSVGWIHKSIVRILKVPKPVYDKFKKDLPPLKESTQNLIPPEFKNHNRVRITSSTVNLRRGPGKQFSISDRAYRYEEPKLLGKRNDWYRIKHYTGATGWIRSDLVEPIWKKSIEKQPKIKIRTSNLRMAPEHQFRETSDSDERYQATLIDQQKPWYQVKLNEKNIGWVLEKEIIQLPQSRTE